MTRIRRASQADCRVLLLDSRRDGLSTSTEGAIADTLTRAGLDVELDAVSDPHSVLRVLADRPHALHDYDAVVAIAPSRADWRGSLKALTEVLAQVGPETPTLLVDSEERAGERLEVDEDAIRPHPDPHIRTLRIAKDTDSTTAARRIGAALEVLLDPLERERPVPAATDEPLPVIIRLREQIGPIGVERLGRIAELVRSAFDVECAEVNLLDGDSVVTVVSAGADPTSLPLDDSLCAIALRNAGITVMTDTWLDSDACRRSPTQGPDALRFYAACPIRSSTGEPIGVLCIWDLVPHARREFDFTFLRDFALLAEGELIAA